LGGEDFGRQQHERPDKAQRDRPQQELDEPEDEGRAKEPSGDVAVYRCLRHRLLGKTQAALRNCLLTVLDERVEWLGLPWLLRSAWSVQPACGVRSSEVDERVDEVSVEEEVAE